MEQLPVVAKATMEILPMDVQNIIMKMRIILNYAGVVISNNEIKFLWKINGRRWKVNRYDDKLYTVYDLGIGEKDCIFLGLCSNPGMYLSGYLPLERGNYYCPDSKTIIKGGQSYMSLFDAV